MRRSRHLSRAAFLAALAICALPSWGAAPYHLALKAYPAAPFPFLQRLGTVTIDVYPGGVRAASLWLHGFSRSGSREVTVMDPIGRSYSELSIAELGAALAKLRGSGDAIPGELPPLLPPVRGTVGGLDASRYRLVYGQDAWIDVWTTTVIPENAQFRAILLELLHGIAPSTATALRSIPGTPLYVELNFRRFRKVPILRLERFVANADGEAGALSVGALYFKSPSLDWK